jgi:hypothetical protein
MEEKNGYVVFKKEQNWHIHHISQPTTFKTPLLNDENMITITILGLNYVH